MNNDRLKIVQQASGKNGSYRSEHSFDRKEIARAKFERLWLTDPEQFNPERNSLEKSRIDRTWELIDKYIDVKEKKCVDLGTGYGTIAKQLLNKNANIEVVDIASIPLKQFEGKVKTWQEYVPLTKLPDDNYDLVLALDLIGYIPQKEHRLFISELTRLVKLEGEIICSTSFDINTEDPLQNFAQLAETELMISHWVFSYHRLFIRIHHLLSIPSFYWNISKNRELRLEELKKRKGFSKSWLSFQSTKLVSFIWGGLAVLISPLKKYFEQNKTVLRFLEKICKAIWDDNGITHAIFLAKKRPLVFSEEEVTIERKGKKQVWE